jgi:hypothetical protein
MPFHYNTGIIQGNIGERKISSLKLSLDSTSIVKHEAPVGEPKTFAILAD